MPKSTLTREAAPGQSGLGVVAFVWTRRAMARLTPRAARCLEHAEDVARELGQSHIGTEHLMLGLLRESDGIAARVLEDLGVAQQVAEEIVRIINAESYRRSSNRVVSRSGEHLGWMVRTDDGTVRLVDDNGRPLTGPLVRQPPPHIEFETD